MNLVSFSYFSATLSFPIQIEPILAIFNLNLVNFSHFPSKLRQFLSFSTWISSISATIGHFPSKLRQCRSFSTWIESILVIIHLISVNFLQPKCSCVLNCTEIGMLSFSGVKEKKNGGNLEFHRSVATFLLPMRGIITRHHHHQFQRQQSRG